MSVFHQTDWLVRRVKAEGRGTGGALLAIGDIANASGCHLAIFESTEWYKREDGCLIIPFKFKSPSNEAFNQCLRSLSDYINFTSIKEISAKDFETGNTEEFLASLMSSLDFAFYVEELAEHNESILDKANR